MRRPDERFFGRFGSGDEEEEEDGFGLDLDLDLGNLPNLQVLNSTPCLTLVGRGRRGGLVVLLGGLGAPFFRILAQKP